jgi:antitoxin ParD1/3/4
MKFSATRLLAAAQDPAPCRTPSDGIVCQSGAVEGIFAMPTRNVVLTDYQAALVERLVTSGRYQNASEVLREGLRLIENEEAEAQARLKALREAARDGIADVEAGRFRTFETAAQLERHLGALAREAIAPRGGTVRRHR